LDILSLTPVNWHKADGDNFQNTARTIPAVASANDPVGSLTDYSGNSNHLPQGTSSKKPSLQTPASGQNGITSLIFDGVDDCLGPKSATQAQPVTLALVAKATTATVNRYFADGGLADRMDLYIGSGVKTTIYAGVNLQEAAVPAGFAIFIGTYNGASSAISVNNGAETTGNAGTASPQGLTLAATGTGSSGFLNCNIQEAILFPSAISAGNKTLLKTYLNVRFGTY
jgi:hypothetical protein